MREHEVSSRLERVENDVSQLTTTLVELRDADTKLSLAVALLEQTMRTIKDADEKRDAFSQRILFFFIAALIGGFMTFVIKGGLVL